MNTNRYLLRKIKDFPKSSQCKLSIEGNLIINSYSFSIESIKNINVQSSLRKLYEIQKGNNSKLEIKIELENKKFYYPNLMGKDGLDFYNFINSYLNVKHSKSKKNKVFDNDLYCLTCESYKRNNSLNICRLCKDTLIKRDYD
jgi:hypothetical protein